MQQRIESLEFWGTVSTVIGVVTACAAALAGFVVCSADVPTGVGILIGGLVQSVVFFLMAALCRGMVGLLNDSPTMVRVTEAHDREIEMQMADELRALHSDRRR